ncbi:Slp family lipoprotein [Glaciecola siphonariae]|uniref:Slp family lipoprotein n=1 Tax=Glaciecola siphonariae TaxID=521012 RepID=A0ABV9LV16_9ALTE
MKNFLLSVISVTLFSACSSAPLPLQVQNENNLVSFTSVMRSQVADVPLGQQARWGGVVVGKLASEDFTELEIVYAPMRNDHSPSKPKAADLRFKALVKNDSLLSNVDTGALVTVVGEISNPTVGLINNRTYTYPTIETDTLHVWQRDISDSNFLDLSSDNKSPWIMVPAWGRNRFERN